MGGNIGLNLEELIKLDHNGELVDHSAAVSIENQTNGQLEHNYIPTEATYSPGRLVDEKTLKLVRIHEDRKDEAQVASLGRVYVDSDLAPVDLLVYKFAFKDSKTRLRSKERVQFKTTFSYKKGNPFRKWTSAWWAQPSWYQSLKGKGTLSFNHRFGLKVPAPGEYMEVKFDPTYHPTQTEPFGDQIIYWWGPLTKKQTLEVNCTYKQVRSRRKMAKKAFTVIFGIAVKPI